MSALPMVSESDARRRERAAFAEGVVWCYQVGGLGTAGITRERAVDKAVRRYPAPKTTRPRIITHTTPGGITHEFRIDPTHGLQFRYKGQEPWVVFRPQETGSSWRLVAEICAQLHTLGLTEEVEDV